MIAEPPFEVGAAQLTLARKLSGIAFTFVGGRATVKTGVEIAEFPAGELPTAFVATTLNVYLTPLLIETNAHEVVMVVQLYLGGDEVTRYRSIEDPPFDIGCIHETLIELPCDWLEIVTGAEGTSKGDVGNE